MSRARRFGPAALALATMSAALAVATADDRLAGIPAAEARLEAAAAARGVRFPLEKVAIRVEKKARRLTLVAGGKALRTYKVGLGFAPEGPKEREGDGRTPEGDYYVCTRNDKSRFHLFLGLSYPAPRDAARARATGAIDAATAAKVEAIRSPAAPPWNTKLGGEVGIHGHGASKDWTLGCVALEDADVDELWAACPLGTPVRVDP